MIHNPAVLAPAVRYVQEGLIWFIILMVWAIVHVDRNGAE